VVGICGPANSVLWPVGSKLVYETINNSAVLTNTVDRDNAKYTTEINSAVTCRIN